MVERQEDHGGDAACQEHGSSKRRAVASEQNAK
jgi:hypothetical protein